MPLPIHQLQSLAKKGQPVDMREVMFTDLHPNALKTPLTSALLLESGEVPTELAIDAGLLNPSYGEAKMMTITEVGAGGTDVTMLRGLSGMSPMNRQGGPLGASNSTTTSSRASGAFRVADSRAEHRWI